VTKLIQSEGDAVQTTVARFTLEASSVILFAVRIDYFVLNLLQANDAL
jgi:hypothetical protein